jgi:hypothetical protein
MRPPARLTRRQGFLLDGERIVSERQEKEHGLTCHLGLDQSETMSRLSKGAIKVDPEHGELVLQHRTPRGYGDTAWYWRASDGSEVPVTAEEAEDLRPPRRGSLSGN